MTETGLKISKTRKILIIINFFLVAGLAVGLVFKYRPGSHSERADVRTVGLTQPTLKTNAATTTSTTTERVKPFILILGSSSMLIDNSFLVSEDGSVQKRVGIIDSFDNHGNWGPFASIEGELFIFGGDFNKQRILKLINCELIEQSARLVHEIDSTASALSISDGSKALICFPGGDGSRMTKECEIFDGRRSEKTFSSIFSHASGKLALYKGKAAAIGDLVWVQNYRGSGNNCEACKSKLRVEKLDLSRSGWYSMPDFPRLAERVLAIGFESGNLLVAGRFYGVFLLAGSGWKEIGVPITFDKYSSVIRIEKSVFVVSGNSIERFDFEQNRIKVEEFVDSRKWAIKEMDNENTHAPVLLQVSADYCI